ncbi:Hypothetical predicted protein [Mytilus galloprovincialis]|uniref:PWWP domain-containing protein n=1 Tax=Mytilus galloprovincialis TaxID=29158 RepID=A0A8B6CWN8_MYTGA|nr:Hypothetical predicted protein [Mytilus galloprovincialis]
MAETRRQNKIISKGSKLPVTIEDAIEDALIVCLDYGARKYRGILLDSNKRNIPHGVCSRFKGAEGNGIETEDGNIEVPATYFRHTYMQHENKMKEHVPVKNVHKDKNTRQHIRLRPRQMLCNKCKAMCQETDKGIVPITAVPKQGTKPENTTNNKTTASPSKEGFRRRPSNQNLKAENHSVSKTIKLEKLPDKISMMNTNMTKASPFIKINIGAGTVLQIPPRLHGDEVDGVSNKGDSKSSEPKTVNQLDDSSHRKLKKLKFKELEKECENDSVAEHISADIYHHKKHKRKHKRKHEEELKNSADDMVKKCDENNDNLQYCDSNKQTIMSQRPRLLYTWRQNKGLSPRRDIDNTYNIKMSPQQSVQSIDKIDLKPRKEYRLRSREKSIEEVNESCVSSDSSHTSMSESDDNVIMSAGSEDDNEVQFNASSVNEDSQSSAEDNEEEEEADGPPVELDENIEVLRPLMMKIQTRDVTKCIKTDGRTVQLGDIVWGKIKGFPWWPGRVLSITVSSRESGVVLRQLAHLAWFGSSTMSHIQCSDLYPFLEDFKVRYNKKKRGPYKMAIKQATIAAQSLTNTHHIDFTEFDL